MLSKKQLQDVCLFNDKSHNKCRYLSQDDNDYTKYYCLKKNSEAQAIDKEVNSFIRECNRKGKNPYAENVPMGNNCKGYPLLKFIEQGYDKDKP